MKLIFFDNDTFEHLKPFTFTRPTAEIRIGIFTISEKWTKTLKADKAYLTQDYLQEKFPLNCEADETALFIAGNILPTEELTIAITSLKKGEALQHENNLLVAHCTLHEYQNKAFQTQEFEEPVFKIEKLWHVFSFNGRAIEEDIKLLSIEKGIPNDLRKNNTWIGENVYIEAGAKINAAIINSEQGVVYIGKDSEIMEGSIVRGPFALCEHSVLKMGAKIYGPTTVGPYSKVGGEVGNSVIFGFSNKGHEGFLGNSVLGEWCNLGADTNNSNLKNNYGNVKLWNYALGKMEDSGLQFCGLMMGDHSKCGINTMFNTGTVVGVSANIYGAGFPQNFIPSFAWGGADGFTTYKLDKAMETADRVYERRNLPFDKKEKDIMTKVFEATEKYRQF